MAITADNFNWFKDAKAASQSRSIYIIESLADDGQIEKVKELFENDELEIVKFTKEDPSSLLAGVINFKGQPLQGFKKSDFLKISNLNTVEVISSDALTLANYTRLTVK